MKQKTYSKDQLLDINEIKVLLDVYIEEANEKIKECKKNNALTKASEWQYKEYFYISIKELINSFNKK